MEDTLRRSHHGLGQKGEKAAIAYLKKIRYRVIATGYRFLRGEIDIIAYDRSTLVFIEVKTRKSRDFGFPEESVTPAKREQIRKIAHGYLLENRLSDVECRFDILSLNWSEEGPRIHHIKDAF